MKRLKKSILLILVAGFLTGCWDERILEELAMITILTVDVAEEDSPYLIVSATFPEFSKRAKEPETLISTKARSLREAMEKLNAQTDKKIVQGQIQVVLLGEEFARGGIQSTLDTLYRDVDVSAALYVCITEGRADELIARAFQDKPMDGFYLSRLIQKQREVNMLPATPLHQFQSEYLSKRTDPVLPYVHLGKNEAIAAETAVFFNDRFVESLNSMETQLLVMLRNDGTSSQFTKEIESGSPFEQMTISFVDSHTTVDVEERGGEGWHFNVNLRLSAELTEYEKREHVLTDKKFAEIAEEFSRYLEKTCQEMVRRIHKQHQADPMGLGEYTRPLLPVDTSLEEWRKKFTASTMSITVDLDIIHDGDFRE
ncbi:Ger(x)C family spore germination protein [Halalkalibacterium halodurans]|uniref:Ger(x)C family spore germination protein n=1 Tax=Halalkalibacterium halodurans TaxID=86665 RepID=UPI002E2414CB|nr:Ger(x)C family spore germination protein [Halalkalibacterium halodurans]